MLNLPLNTINLSDNLAFLKTLPDNSIDAVITDSPYGLGKQQDLTKLLPAWVDHGYYEVKGSGFMGKKWDAFVPQPRLWKECLRILKPGGYLVSFFGTRTYHLGSLAIELAGFEIRDMITWHYASGFPKSLDISKAIDKAAGAEREVVGIIQKLQSYGKGPIYGGSPDKMGLMEITAASTDEAKKWQGWGNALKPATEPICVARKPLEGTTVETVLKYGTGGINIDESRIETDEIITNHSRGSESAKSKGKYGDSVAQQTHQTNGQHLGRFPANVIFDSLMAAELDQQTGVLKSGGGTYTSRSDNKIYGAATPKDFTGYADSGGASRFFKVIPYDGTQRFIYCAKASTKERAGATHPTVKPLALMLYLVKLFCPPGGTVIDPHNGQGTTCEACLGAGMNYIGIDNDPVSHREALQRIYRWHYEK